MRMLVDSGLACEAFQAGDTIGIGMRTVALGTGYPPAPPHSSSSGRRHNGVLVAFHRNGKLVGKLLVSAAAC